MMIMMMTTMIKDATRHFFYSFHFFTFPFFIYIQLQLLAQDYCSDSELPCYSVQLIANSLLFY